MPTPLITKIDPRDLSPNIAVGISLPFNGNSVFKKTYTTQDQVKYNIINLILTNKGERLFDPNFGSSIRMFLFEGISDESIDLIKSSITDSVSQYIPEIQISNINIDTSIENTLTITIAYNMVLSGAADFVAINFV
jgi:phage baseplate assembly protein W